MTFLFPKREKTVSELEDENQKLKLEEDNKGMELSIAEKRQAIKKLKQDGLSPSHFGFDWKKIMKFLNEKHI